MNHSYPGQLLRRDLVWEARDRLEELRKGRADYLRRRSEIEGSTYLSELEKQHHMKLLSREAPDRLKSASVKLWGSFEEARALIERAIEAAHQSGVRWDYGKLSYLKDEFEARLSAPVVPAIFNGESVVERVARLRAQAVEANDLHALRALRLAAAPLLDRAGLEGSERVEASSLLAAFREDEEAETPAEVRALAAERLEIEALRSEARAEILSTEEVLTGEMTGIFRPVTAWGREVLGEAPEDTGAGVHWSERARRDAEQWAVERRAAGGAG